MTLVVPTFETARLETDRLVLRGWRESDLAPLSEFFANDPGVEYVGGPVSALDAWRRMTSFVGHWHLKGYGPFALELRDSGDWIGWCALWQPPDFPEIEMGYALRAAHRGHGFIQEAGLSVKAFAFETLQLPTLVSYIDPQNSPSQRAAERLGAQRDGTVELRGTTAEVWRYPRAGAAA